MVSRVRKVGEGRYSLKIEVIKGVTESDPPYMVMIEGVRAETPQEIDILKAVEATEEGIPAYFREKPYTAYMGWLK